VFESALALTSATCPLARNMTPPSLLMIEAAPTPIKSIEPQSERFCWHVIVPDAPFLPNAPSDGRCQPVSRAHHGRGVILWSKRRRECRLGASARTMPGREQPGSDLVTQVCQRLHEITEGGEVVLHQVGDQKDERAAGLIDRPRVVHLDVCGIRRNMQSAALELPNACAMRFQVTLEVEPRRFALREQARVARG
jgi:hypothetical protein